MLVKFISGEGCTNEVFSLWYITEKVLAKHIKDFCLFIKREDLCKELFKCEQQNCSEYAVEESFTVEL